MISRVILALVAAAIVTLATTITWSRLKAHEQEQIARIAESESYAARSRLVRSVDMMLRALRDVHIYWSTFGHLPRDQWADDAGIELAHFAGIELILWTEPGQSLRYTRNTANPVFDHRPGDDEWALYRDLLEKSEELSGEHMLGPYRTRDGNILLEVYFVPKSSRVDGTLIAIVDTEKALNQLLAEDSPGFAITVKAKDTVIYRRGEPASGLPANWTRSGFIENSVGTVWEVIHTPTAELARSMQTPAVDAVLYAGVAIAVLVGLLLIETGRANDRAQAALQARQELAELNQDLELQVAERTQDLEERSRDIVTITDSVGHDLRNPLNAVSANIQLLEQQFSSPLGSEGLDILSRLSSGVTQMADILDRLLSLSTVSNTEFERERLDLREMAEEIFSELEIGETGASVDFLAEDVPDAMGEPVMVQTLLMNLLSNALKYTRAKPVRKIVFSCDRSGDLPAYYLQDNGIGFDSEMADRIFSAFERLPNNGQTEGLGLGLDIASRVVRRHGGKIWAKGKPDGGATFYFTLGEAGVVG